MLTIRNFDGYYFRESSDTYTLKDDKLTTTSLDLRGHLHPYLGHIRL